MCVQRTVNGSEDCLCLGLYSRPWTNPSAKRLVSVTFHGGAFREGSASFTIPPPTYPVLNVSQANDFIVVYPNYRLNAFGLLPGRKVKESPTADLNPGLLDQQAALAWVHKYISHFGGNPQNVIIWGQSAGAGSVVARIAGIPLLDSSKRQWQAPPSGPKLTVTTRQKPRPSTINWYHSQAAVKK